MKFSQIKLGFTALLITLILLFTSASVFATSDLDDESEVAGETVAESETMPETENGDNDTSTPSHSESDVSEPHSHTNGGAETTTKPTVKPSSTTETRRRNNGSNGNGGNAERDNDNNFDRNADADVTPDDDDDDGKFTVYIELNNGEERLKFDLEEAGTVPEPQEKPQRKGFKFAGWFSDPEFKTRWDFSKDIAEKGTVIYVKWEPDEGTVLHKITVSALSGGTLEVNPPSAAKGETVNITVKPEAGKRLKAGSILINGNASDYLSFVMPEGDVVISAEFEDVLKTAEESNKKTTVVIICVIAAVVIAAAVAFFSVRKKRVKEDDGDVWVDDSIKLQEGFKDGRVVKPDDDDGTIVISDDDGTVILSGSEDIADTDD